MSTSTCAVYRHSSKTVQCVLLTVLYTGASFKTVQCLPLPVLYTDTQFQNSPMCASNCPLQEPVLKQFNVYLYLCCIQTHSSKTVQCVLLTVLYTGASFKTVQCLPLPVLYTDTQFQSVLLTVLYTGASFKTVQCLPLPVLYTDTQFQNSPMCASNCPLYRRQF